MIKLNFEPLTLGHRALIESYWPLANPACSVHQFNALFMWRHAYNTEVCEVDHILFLRRNSDLEKGFLFPLCQNQDDLPKALDLILGFCKETGFPRRIIDLDSLMLERLTATGRPHLVVSDRANAEYLYDADKLRTLSGKKMHSKKNRYNKFIKNYQYEVKDIRNATGPAYCMAKRWLKGKENALTENELLGIRDCLSSLNKLSLTGLAVFVNGSCQAFTLSERISPDTVLVHIEKANDDIDGLFTFINAQNLEINHPDVLIANREQDMGLEGLRKAKLSWKPKELLDKYTVTLQ
ncbi:hypothetical protein ABB02_00264 [Clostridiaceae bacterium JG1575]|nr:hypothetical protein ABB02_00264 [Clostridiaceae bacterium JG1575]